jgi:hypothetical protein
MGLDGLRFLLSVDDHFCFNSLCLYIPVVSRMFSSRCAINIGVGASFSFLRTRCQSILIAGPPDAPAPPSYITVRLLGYGTVTKFALADGPTPLMLGDDIVSSSQLAKQLAQSGRHSILTYRCASGDAVR